ncbi:MAG: hypothetical protein WC599_06450 [Bacteroidales bacterium]
MSLLKILYILSIVVIICTLVSCELIDPEEQIPSYIHIDSIGVSTQGHYSEYGSSSHKITDAWVYIDDQLIGAFELPATFPVLWEGTHTVTVKPGIKVNGISATRSIYPFYEPYVVSLNLVKDSIITLNPTVTYFPSTVKWKEDFEVGISLEETLFSDTTIVQTLAGDPEAFEGYSGVVHLDATRDFFQCKTINSYELPRADNPVFLEMNYKTNEKILVGLYANSTTQTERLEILNINSSNTWNKIYINLNNAINRTTINPDNFHVFFEVQKSSDVSNSKILFDNIKLVYN